MIHTHVREGSGGGRVDDSGEWTKGPLDPIPSDMHRREQRVLVRRRRRAEAGRPGSATTDLDRLLAPAQSGHLVVLAHLGQVRVAAAAAGKMMAPCRDGRGGGDGRRRFAVVVLVLGERSRGRCGHGSRLLGLGQGRHGAPALTARMGLERGKAMQRLARLNRHRRLGLGRSLIVVVERVQRAGAEAQAGEIGRRGRARDVSLKARVGALKRRRGRSTGAVVRVERRRRV